MLKLRFVEIAAHLHKLPDGDIASAAASKVRATFCAALDDALHLGCHLGAFWQRAVLKTVHVLPTLPVARDDFEAFLTFLLHLLHGKLVVFLMVEVTKAAMVEAMMVEVIKATVVKANVVEATVVEATVVEATVVEATVVEAKVVVPKEMPEVSFGAFVVAIEVRAVPVALLHLLKYSTL